MPQVKLSFLTLNLQRFWNSKQDILIKQRRRFQIKGNIAAVWVRKKGRECSEVELDTKYQPHGSS